MPIQCPVRYALAAVFFLAAARYQSAEPLARAFEVTGFSRNGGKVLHWHDVQSVEQNY